MDATTAMNRTYAALDPVFAGLQPEHREMSTPCTEWTVHDLIAHMCGGAHGIAGGLQGQAPPEGEVDHLSEGPVNGWNDAKAALTAAAKRAPRVDFDRFRTDLDAIVDDSPDA